MLRQEEPRGARGAAAGRGRRRQAGQGRHADAFGTRWHPTGRLPLLAEPHSVCRGSGPGQAQGIRGQRGRPAAGRSGHANARGARLGADGVLQPAGGRHGVELASGSEQDKAALARAGYIELATEAMKAHSQDADLLSASCSLLRLLTSANDRRVSLVVRTGCIDVVVGALRAHAKHPGVQSAGCALLMNLTVKSQERCSEVIQKGGMQIAATAIRTYTGNGPVQEAAGMLVATLQSGGTPTGGWAGALQKPAWMSGPREVRTSTFYDTRDDGRLLL
mmetsp:Transcript_153209/g.371943  ORF Transcript_153209/g.371943 Transcript_153209/m.371943 type:complete len:277 (-) Transcript_153209:89-919(-)